MPITLKQDGDQNAGDASSAFVVSHVLSESVNIVGLTWRAGPNLIATGSILEAADEGSVVWGSGFIKAGARVTAAPKAVLAVRGELTRAELNDQGIDCDPILGDPGVFIPDVFPRGPVHWTAGIVPHYVDHDEPLVERARAEGLRVIDPLMPFAAFIGELAACERIISSSLHGLIFAHAYGIPAVWVQMSDRVIGNGFKFRDYYTSVGVREADVPNPSRDSSVTCLIEQCHLPLRQVDKSAMRAVLSNALDFLRN